MNDNALIALIIGGGVLLYFWNKKKEIITNEANPVNSLHLQLEQKSSIYDAPASTTDPNISAGVPKTQSPSDRPPDGTIIQTPPPSIVETNPPFSHRDGKRIIYDNSTSAKTEWNRTDMF